LAIHGLDGDDGGPDQNDAAIVVRG
jgi:hypothetical protein